MTEASETFDGFARVREMLEAVERRMAAIERMAPLRPAPEPGPEL